MLLAWRQPALEATCASEAAIARHWPGRGVEVKHLLSAVMHAPDLATLARLRMVRLRVANGSVEAGSHLSVELEEVEMHASAMMSSGQVIAMSDRAAYLEHASGAPALLITDMVASGVSALRRPS